jgi:hypothetical protein
VVAAVVKESLVAVGRLDAAAELVAALVAVAVAVEEFDECLEVSSTVGAVVDSVLGWGSAVGVAVAVADGVGVAAAVVGLGEAVAVGVAAVDVPDEVEVLVCALTTTPGATSVEVDVAPCVPDVVAVVDGSVVDCVADPDVGSGLAVPVEPVDVEPVDELDEEVESVVSADATP